MSARKTYTPAEALLADQLRAEARAWRRAAEALDAMEYVEGSLRTWLDRQRPMLAFAMQSRATPHMLDAMSSGVPSDLDEFSSWLVDFSRVWFCLILALECEDEAQEAAGG